MNIYIYVDSIHTNGFEKATGQRFESAMLESLFELVNYYPKMAYQDRAEKLNEFLNTYAAEEKNRPAIVDIPDERSWFGLVNTVYAAAGCSGDVQCGDYVSCNCSNNSAWSCAGPTDDIHCGSGDCICDCQSDGSTPKKCSGTNKASCNYGGCSATNCVIGKCEWCTPGTEVCESCSVSCGGGTKKCNAGCGNYWVTCNTQSCCTVTKPAVPGVVSPVAPFTEKSGTVTLRWSAVSSWGEECSGTGTRRYEICVGPNSSDPCTGGVNIIASGEASVSATVTGLTSAINYWKIRSINKGGGISDWSSMNNFCFWGSNSLRPLAVTDWSACDGVSHSRSRSCVAGCGCGGVDLAEVCVTEVRGTIFDASFRAVCPGADVYSDSFTGQDQPAGI